MNDRMVSAAERLYGDVLREPEIVKPEAQQPATAVVAPRVTADAVLSQLAEIDRELGEVRALIGTSTTAREWDQVSTRIERVQRVASQAARWARTLATRAHVAMR